MRRFNFLIGLLFLSASATFAASDLSGLNVFPNPVRVYKGNSTVTFDNLTASVKIVILDTNGRMVREVTLENSGFQYIWNLKNDEGDNVASGVYTYLVSTAGATRRGKIAVIR